MGVTINNRIYDIALKKGAVTMGFMTVPQQRELRRRMNEAVPIIGVPGMQLEYAHDVWRPWTLGDFRGGLGQQEWDDPTKFHEMTQGIRIFKNRIQLDTRFYAEDASQNAVKGVDFQSDHYAIVGNKIRKRTGATGVWSQVKAATSDFTDIKQFKQQLWACAPSDKMYWSSDGTTWTAQEQPVTAIRALLAFRGMLWVARDTKMWFSEGPDGGGFLPTDGIRIGDVKGRVNNLAVIGGIIAIGRSDGIYLYEGSGDFAEGPIIDFESMAWNNNCKLFTVVDGLLYYNVGDRVKRTDLQGSEWDVTPAITGTTAKELYGFGTPVGGQGRQGHVYIAFDKAENDYPAVLEMPTIEMGGWRLAYKGASGKTMNGAWFSDNATRLFVNDGTTRSQQFRGRRDAPYPDYVTNAHIITSLFDGGDVWAEKLFGAILAYTHDCSATQNVKLYYSKEARVPSWKLVKTIMSDGGFEIPFDPDDNMVSARKMQLKIELNSASAAYTPALEMPLVVMHVVRPKPTYAHQVALRLETSLEIVKGGTSQWTADDMKTFLRECEAHKLPIEYTDSDGHTWDVIVTRTEEYRDFDFTDLGGTSRREDIMVVTMMEIFTTEQGLGQA